MTEESAGGWRVRPGTWFILQMTAGVFVFAGAAWVFGAIAGDIVRGDPITVLDVQLANWFHAHATEPLTRFMLAVSWLHGLVVVGSVTGLIAAYLGWRRQRYWSLAFLIAVLGGMVLNVVVKELFQRAPPIFDNPLVVLTTFSFPSGHTLAATVFYGTVAAYVSTRVASGAGRAAVQLAALLMVLLVALSRMYLGAHFLTDVLAAIAEGIAWVTMTLKAVATWRRRVVSRATTVA